MHKAGGGNTAPNNFVCNILPRFQLSPFFSPTFLAKPIDLLSELTWRRLSHSKWDGIYLDLEGSVELRDWNALALWDKMQRVDNYMSILEFNRSLCIYATGSNIINPFNSQRQTLPTYWIQFSLGITCLMLSYLDHLTLILAICCYT